jgi:hypothetical protein
MTKTVETKIGFKTLAEFRQFNKETGRHFFDRDTMWFWNSRVESGLIKGRYFITSEDSVSFQGTPERIFAVREANADGSVTTLKSHIADKAAARAELKAFAAEAKNVEAA